VLIVVCVGNTALRWMVRFSYQAILSSNKEAERTSRSPSPSTSALKSDWQPDAAVEITCRLPKLPAPSVFSCQAISEPSEAERTSKSPSPSPSTAKTDEAPSTTVAMICWLPKLPAPSMFSYQAILSSDSEAERTSRSPSPSTSAAKTAWTASAAVEITCWLPKLPAPSVFSYQAILLS